jgi:hypothetical protein
MRAHEIQGSDRELAPVEALVAELCGRTVVLR